MFYRNKFMSGCTRFDKRGVQTDFKFFRDHVSSCKTEQLNRLRLIALLYLSLQHEGSGPMGVSVFSRRLQSSTGSIMHCKGCSWATASLRTLSTRVAAMSRV